MVDQIINDNSNGGLVISAAKPNQPFEIRPASMVKGGIALDIAEMAFVEKTLNYISSINGCISTELSLRTNTKYPSRYIVLISGLPKITLHDFIQISTTNGNIREIVVNMAEGTVKIDVWRQGKKIKKKKQKRKRDISILQTETDLSNVDKRDLNCIRMLIQDFAKLKNVQTQFETKVETSNPEMYSISMLIMDNISIRDIVNIQHKSRTFCRTILFNFPHKQIETECLHLSAPIRRRVLTLANR
mgnify:FL=1|jgi:hypothetical protein